MLHFYIPLLQNGVVHRDLKLENILLDANGDVKVRHSTPSDTDMRPIKPIKLTPFVCICSEMFCIRETRTPFSIACTVEFDIYHTCVGKSVCLFAVCFHWSAFWL